MPETTKSSTNNIPTRLAQSLADLEKDLRNKKEKAEYKIAENSFNFINIVDDEFNELSKGGIKVIDELSNIGVPFYIIKQVLSEKQKILLVKKNERGYQFPINQYDKKVPIYAKRLKIGGKSRKSRRIKRVTKCKRNCRKSRRVKRVTKCKRNCGKSRRVRKSGSK